MEFQRLQVGDMRTGDERKRTAFALLASILVVVATLAACSYTPTTPGATRLSSRPIPAAKLKNFNIKTDFLSAQQCAFCHPTEYREWRTAMHAYAQHSPYFLAFTKLVTNASGGTVGSFCIRCHSPIGISEGESSIIPNDQRHELALESVTCMVCHGEHTRDGQASAVFRVPVPGDPIPTVYGPFYGYDEQGVPDPSQRLIKAPHQSRYSGYIKDGRLCGQCHDVILNEGTRIEEAFSEWRNSPYAHAGVSCQDCHMSPIPGKPVPFSQDYIVDSDLFPNAPKRVITSHKFTGPDYSVLLSFDKAAQVSLGLGDADFKRHEENLELDRETLIRNGATVHVSNPSAVQPGHRMNVEVAVTNTGAGHNFPTGFTAERELWVEITLLDSAGKRLFLSGDLDENNDLRDYEATAVKEGLEPVDHSLYNWEAYFVLQDFRGTQSGFVSTTNRLLSPTPFIIPASGPVSLYGFPLSDRVFKRGIPPLATKTAKYSIPVPQDAKGPLALSVRVRYRNIPSHFAYDIGVGNLRSKLRSMDVYTYNAQIGLGG